jgi:parallel beta-helix repeat protein
MRYSRCLCLCLNILILFSSGLSGSLIVKNTNDAGLGSLRQAILDANATAGLDLIEFALPGPNYVIRPAQPLPVITEPVHISGYSQPGSSPNTLPEGNNAQILVTLDGRDNINKSALKIVAGNSIIEGIAIFGVQFGPAILIEDKGNNSIYGNRIGTYLDDDDLKNRVGIEVRNASENTIGGPEPFQANRIIGSLDTGILLEKSNLNTIRKNEISENFANGIEMESSDQNQILGNRISNTSYGSGIVMSACSGNFIGDGTPDNANTISGNRFLGVHVDDRGVNNLIAINRIFDNQELGINLTEKPSLESGISLGFYSSVTPNDLAPDADEGGNQLQNFPILERADRTDGGLVALKGRFTSAADTTYRIDVYANAERDSSGHGEGQAHMATFSITTNSGGNALIDRVLSAQPGLHISATATDPLNNTSEFSPSVPVRSSTITVTSLDPDGPGSLAEAIELANQADTSDGYVVIGFEFPNESIRIDLLDELIITNDRVFLDGFGPLRSKLFEVDPQYLTQHGVLLEGGNSASGNGIDLQGDEGIVEGFGLNNYTGSALRIGGSKNSVSGNSFGGPNGNATTWGNGNGVDVYGGVDNRIGSTVPSLENLFNGNKQTGIRIRGLPEVPVEGTRIRGNRIENTQGPGIRVENATGTRIGGWSRGSGNIMRFNNGPGIEDDGTDTTGVGGNSIQNNTGLPFDIGGDGETPNDNPDTDGNPNYPGVSSAILSSDGRTIAVAGSLVSPVGTSTAAWIGAFLVGGATAQDGGRYVGGAPVTTDSDGQTDLTLEIELPADQLSGGAALRFIASSDTFGSSEYSPVTIASQMKARAWLSTPPSVAPTPHGIPAIPPHIHGNPSRRQLQEPGQRWKSPTRWRWRRIRIFT